MPALEAAHLGSKAAMVVKVTSAMQAKGAAVASSAMQAKGAAVASQVIFEEVPSATLATWSFPPLWPLGHFHHFGHGGFGYYSNCYYYRHHHHYYYRCY